MCDSRTENDIVGWNSEWQDNLLWKVFEDCHNSSNVNGSGIKNDSKVHIDSLIGYIQKNLPEESVIGFVEKWAESLKQASIRGHVDWATFKKVSKPWIDDAIGQNNNYINTSMNNAAQDYQSPGVQYSGDPDQLNDDIKMYRYTSVWHGDISADGTQVASSGNQSKADENSDCCENQTSSHSDERRNDSVNHPRSANTSTLGTMVSSSGQVVADESTETTDVDLRLKVQRVEVDNNFFKEELIKAESSIGSLQTQCKELARKLDAAVEKCKQLQQENDEDKESLNNAEKKEELLSAALKKAERDAKKLTKDLEMLKNEKEKLMTNLENEIQEKDKHMKNSTKYKEMLDEKERENEVLKERSLQLENTNTSLQDSYDTVVTHLQNLRQEQQELRKSHIRRSLNDSSNNSMEILSPAPSPDSRCSPQTEKESPPDTLFDELKASGFPVLNGEDNLRSQELEDELNWYDDNIAVILEEVEKIVKQVAAIFKTPKSPVPNSRVEDCEQYKAPNLTTLREKIFLLSKMMTEPMWKGNYTDSCTQVRADAVEAERLDEFSVIKFVDRLKIIFDKNQEALASDELTAGNLLKKDKNYLGLSNPAVNQTITTPVQIEECSIIYSAIDQLEKITRDAQNDLAKLNERETTHNPRSIHTLPAREETAVKISACLSDFNCKINNFTQDLAIGSCGDASTHCNVSADAGSVTTSNLHATVENDNQSGTDTLNMLEESLKDSACAQVDGTKTLDESPVTTSSSLYSRNNEPAKSTPRRKLSVFHRSFDYSSIQEMMENDQEASKDPPPPADYNNFGVTYARDYSGPSVLSDNSASSKSQLDSSFSDKSASTSATPTTTTSAQRYSRGVILASPKLKLPLLKESSDDLDIVKKNDSEGCNLTSKWNTNATYSLESLVLDQAKITQTHENLTYPLESSMNLSQSQDASFQLSCLSSPSSSMIESKDTPDQCESNVTDEKSLEKSNDLNKSEYRRWDERRGATRAEDVCVKATVELTMSSDEDSSGSESDSMITDERTSVAHELSISNKVALGSSTPFTPMTKICSLTLDQRNERANVVNGKSSMKFNRIKRSLSTSDTCQCEYRECCCRKLSVANDLISRDAEKPKAFPSLTDSHLRESGVANLQEGESDAERNNSEEDLQKKFAATSIILNTDKITLRRRLQLSIRQRDQAENNTTFEFQKMQQDIQDLASLCIDRESLEIVEKVQRQLEMVAKCTQRISSTSETLGAVHQEQRLTRAVLIADRYLQFLRSRCEKLASELVDTKRILTENNIVIEETTSELGDDTPRLRYRSGVPTNNRTMMARRRASVATMSRPIVTVQDLTKDGVRQRNSVSGRVTVRRPSLSYDTHKWDTERLDRTESTGSISELQEIFEQAESRRTSREENNNLVRNLSQSNSILTCDTANPDFGIWTTATTESPANESLTAEDTLLESRDQRTLVSRASQFYSTWKPILWCIFLSFFFGFYVKDVLSSINVCRGPCKWWSIEEILSRYLEVKHVGPRPI